MILRPVYEIGGLNEHQVNDLVFVSFVLQKIKLSFLKNLYTTWHFCDMMKAAPTMLLCYESTERIEKIQAALLSLLCELYGAPELQAECLRTLKAHKSSLGVPTDSVWKMPTGIAQCGV